MKYLRSLIVVLAWVSIHCYTEGAFDGTLKKRICNGETYSQHQLFFDGGEPYECAVNNMMSIILSATERYPSYKFYYGGQCPGLENGPYTYGYGSCRKELQHDDCGDCLDAAKSRLFEECTHSVGAQVELQDCQIRYENYQFKEYPLTLEW